MPDQIITADKARQLQTEMCNNKTFRGWKVLMQDPLVHQNSVIARLETEPKSSSPYVLAANSLDEVQAQLPPRLVRVERHPDDEQELIEQWVMTQRPSLTSTGSDSTGTFEHAMSLLTAISTTTQLFVGLTGAAWAVLVPNTMALPTCVVVLALGLHGLLGIVIFLVLRGLGANMEQRLNLGRWKEHYGGRDGIGEAAWFGVPSSRYGLPPAGPLHPSTWLPNWIPDKVLRGLKRVAPPSLENTISSWRHDNRNESIDRSYAVPRYPTLRIQRTAWPLVPFCAAVGSFYLSYDAWTNRTEHVHACDERFALLRQATTPLDFDRARYLLDKASCDVSTQPISENRLEPREHKAACDERFALLRQAATPLDLDRARYLLDKANCNIGSRPVASCPNGQDRCGSLGG